MKGSISNIQKIRLNFVVLKPLIKNEIELNFGNFIEK